MDDRGPRISLQTKPSQLDKKRFELEWILPLEPGLSTHVTPFDLEFFPPHAVMVGEGADEGDALLRCGRRSPARTTLRTQSPTSPTRTTGALVDNLTERARPRSTGL